MKLDAQKLAKEIFDAFTLRLSKATGRDAPTWGSLSGNERGSFRDAVEEVVIRQIELLALDMKLDDLMADVLPTSEPPPVPQRKVIALGPGPLCYYCSRGVAIKWYACADCLKI